jgi:hypothetical protein
MTAAVTTPPDPSTLTVARRAAAAEWTRLWSLRSTWWSLAAATGLMLFVGLAAGAGHDGVEPAPIWQPAQLAIVPSQFAFLLVVLLPVTGEYATGAIRSTLQWVPRRGVLLVARIVVPVATTTAFAVVAAAATNLVVWGLVGPAAEVVAGDIAASIARIALVVAFDGLLTVGIGLLLRSTAGTLTALFLLLFALVIALGNTGIRWLTVASDHLPGRAVMGLVDEGELAAGTVATVIVAWTLTSLLAGSWSLLRRDTT